MLLNWLRGLPLLKELPQALADYLMGEENMPAARRREVDALEYLRCKIGDRVRIFVLSIVCARLRN